MFCLPLLGTEALVWYVTSFGSRSPSQPNNYSIISLIESNCTLHLGTYGPNSRLINAVTTQKALPVL